MARVVFIFVWTVFFLGGCDNYTDVTKDSKYAFAAIAGSTWRLKVPIKIITGGHGEICTEQYAADFAAGTANRNESGPQVQVEGVLMSGTVIQVDRLEKLGWETGGYDVYVSVKSGKHAGETIIAPAEIFRPNFFITPESTSKTWAINPDNLEKP